MADNTLKFGPFRLGVNNVDRATNLTPGELVDAVNVDIDRDGRIIRRPGYTRVIDEINTHSLWGRDHQTAFYASGTDLKKLTVDSAGLLTPSVLRAGALQVFQPVAFTEVNGDTYYSNGIVRGCIRAADNADHDWGCEAPVFSPVLAAIAGALPAGRYQVGLAFLNDRGEHSGMRPPVTIELAAQGGIALSSIQPALHADVTTVRVYVSQTNGEELYRYQDYPIGTTTASITGLVQLGQRASTIHLDQLPASSMLESFNGRIYGASGRIVWFTDALNYGLSDPRKNFLQFSSDVSVMLAVNDGMYFGTADRVYFYAGAGPEKFEPRIVQMFGAVKGTGMHFPKTEDGGEAVGWFSERGFTKGLNGGTVQLGDKERIMIGQYARGSSLYREANGLRQVVGTMRNQVRAGFVSSDYAEAEVRRGNLVII